MLEEIFIASAKLPVDPETPFPQFRAAQQQRPASLVYYRRMPMFCLTKGNPPHLHPVVPILGTVDVAAPQDERNKPPRMVVHRPLIVRRDPMVQPDTEPSKIGDPSNEVRATFLSQLFPPFDFHSPG